MPPLDLPTAPGPAIDPATVDDVVAPDAYRVVGPIYDALTRLASGRAIDRTRLAMVSTLAPGTTVLFAGVGHGTDALAARRCGAHVIVVDASATMLERCRRTLAGAGFTDGVTFIHGDLRALTPAAVVGGADGGADVVVANFFLNVFGLDDARAVLAQLVGLGRPGGRLVIGDFHAPSHNALLRAVQRLHFWLAVSVFHAVTGNAVRALVDYGPMLQDAGVVVEERRAFTVFGLPLYEAIVGRLTGRLP